MQMFCQGVNRAPIVKEKRNVNVISDFISVERFCFHRKMVQCSYGLFEQNVNWKISDIYNDWLTFRPANSHLVHRLHWYNGMAFLVHWFSCDHNPCRQDDVSAVHWSRQISYFYWFCTVRKKKHTHRLIKIRFFSSNSAFDHLPGCFMLLKTFWCFENSFNRTTMWMWWWCWFICCHH